MNMKVRRYQSGDQDAVVELWRRCELVVPHNDPVRDIALKQAWQPELFLIGELDGHLVASVMAGYEGHRGWINYLAVDPAAQGRGLGRIMMAEAENALRALGCPKINLQVRTTNAAVRAFYERVGYSVDNVISLGKRL